MKLIEGVDYWVRQVEFPNMGSPSVVASNGDGTFTGSDGAIWTVTP